MMTLLLTKRTLPRELAEQLPDKDTKLYELGRCLVMVGREFVNEARDDLRWHLSISHPQRFPTWAEIGEARDRLLPPDVWLVVPHPPREWWLSLHPNCFHLWELRDENLIGQWKFDGEKAKRAGVNAPQPEHRITP